MPKTTRKGLQERQDTPLILTVLEALEKRRIKKEAERNARQKQIQFEAFGDWL